VFPRLDGVFYPYSPYFGTQNSVKNFKDTQAHATFHLWRIQGIPSEKWSFFDMVASQYEASLQVFDDFQNLFGNI